jgi:hypothetical protein
MRFTTAVMCLAMVTCALASGKGKTPAKDASKGALTFVVDIEKIPTKIDTEKWTFLKKPTDDIVVAGKAIAAAKKPEDKKKLIVAFFADGDVYETYGKAAVAHFGTLTTAQLKAEQDAADKMTDDKQKEDKKKADAKIAAMTKALIEGKTALEKVMDEATFVDSEMFDKDNKIVPAKATEFNKKLAAVKTACEKFGKDLDTAGFKDMEKLAKGSTESESAFPIVVIILIVVGVLAIAGVAAFFCLRKKNESD